MRVLVFVDAANVYRDARRAFFDDENDFGIYGQVNPGLFGDVLLGKTQVPDAELVGVRVYTGRPDGTLSPKTYAAHMRQCAAWEKDSIVTVKWRPIRYPWGTLPPGPGEPDRKGQQKGVDVQLAVDLVRMYLHGEYDVGIVASTDTDLLPAIETLYEFDRAQGFAPVETSAWHSDTMKKALHLTSHPLWCHRLDISDYAKCRDVVDYNIVP